MEEAENRMDEAGRPEDGGQGKKGGRPEGRWPRKRIWLPLGVFILTILLLVLHRCDRELPPVEPPLLPPRSLGVPETLPDPPLPDTPPAPLPPKETVRPALKPIPPPDTPMAPDTPATRAVAADSGLPYLYADPWGGRHFDSVRVSLHCREGCLVLYSLEDSVNFKTYQDPFTFRRNTTVWLSGIDSAGRSITATRIEYVIERNPGSCREGNMPVMAGGRTVCMDVYEWPNLDGEQPRAFVTWKEAADSCKGAGKRLCSAEEWRAACEGPDRESYPYSGRYNENHCPAKEGSAARSGRFPACRSYYGLFDMTGNLWEWTSTPAGAEREFFLVAGGNWSAGGEARCGYSKFSFYPAVRYPFVGFRCCRDATKP